MCAICMRSPCDPRCPNAPEPPTVYTCKHCGEPIVPGDEFYEKWLDAQETASSAYNVKNVSAAMQLIFKVFEDTGTIELSTPSPISAGSMMNGSRSMTS